MAISSTDIQTKVKNDERRRGKRLPLRWEARLMRRSGGTVRTTTQNLSNCGFYCVTPERLIPGEEFDCYIMLPSSHVAAPHQQVVLLCRGRVVRVEFVSAESYGIGCQIEDYLLIPE